jgi:hypothetical protein
LKQTLCSPPLALSPFLVGYAGNEPLKRRVKSHLPFASIIRRFKVHVSVHRMYIPIYITNRIQRYTVYLYLETALHVSGGTFTHHQECIQLYLQHLVFVTMLLLSAAIVEVLEPV